MTMEVVTRALEVDDKAPFLESDACIELQGLIDRTVTSEESCSMKERVSPLRQ